MTETKTMHDKELKEFHEKRFFVGICAGTLDTIAYQFEGNALPKPISNEAIAKALRNIAKKLHAINEGVPIEICTRDRANSGVLCELKARAEALQKRLDEAYEYLHGHVVEYSDAGEGFCKICECGWNPGFPEAHDRKCPLHGPAPRHAPDCPVKERNDGR